MRKSHTDMTATQTSSDRPLHVFSVLLLFFLLSFSSADAFSDELQVLLKLKSSMAGPGSSGLKDWSSSNPHCSFSGVVCDQNSRVISLNVSFVPLFGTIPPEIGLLNKLVNLTLASDNLTGPLPITMSNLTSLKLLDLSTNNFSGNFPGKMIVTMTELEIIHVYNNNLTGNLPVEFAELKNLKVLHLGGNYFNGEIPEAFSEFQSLQVLGLQGNWLTGRIPAGLAKVSTLQELYLGYFNVYHGGIPPELGSLSSLRILDLGGCNLTGEIPTSLSNLKMLHTLFLQINNLTGQIPPELSGLANLMSLDLSLNELTGEIPESFSQLENLTLLNLFSNHLYGRIPSFIGDLPNLEVLQIWGNNFTYALPANLGGNGKLLLLDVSVNHLNGAIPRDLCKGGKLRTLILMANFFFGPIPEELGKCDSLTKIRISKNFFNGTVPPGFFKMPALDIMELSDNYFTGELPTEMSASSLGILVMSNNRITGKIPPAIGNMASIVTLYLDVNQFSGEIPTEISNLKHLYDITLRANNLTGEIPASIARCTKLTLIDLSSNSLSGELPGSISKLKNINKLNLSSNRLTGEIPVEIVSKTSLATLDLSDNNFSGDLPTIGQMQYYNDSSFSGNPNLCFPRRQSCPRFQNPSPASRGGHTASSGASKVIIILIVVVTFVLLMVVTFIRIRKKKLEKSRAWKLTTFQQRLYFRVEDVLECLIEENIIGKGGAGIVYRGTMPKGDDVAIKRLVGCGGGGRHSSSDHGFSAEIMTLGRIRHRNIVRLLGYVTNKETNLLVYEYMPNGSLGEMLHGAKGSHLQWETRYRIAVEAAKGLCYLHHDCTPLILHRDVKSNNILLDSDYEAHVADFGLAKFLMDAAGASECMSSIAGSYGYIAPEYAYTLKVDEKSDVYSFGVVLLELVAGRKPVGEFGDGVDIVMWVRRTISELSQPSDAASVLAVVDPRLSGYPLPSVINLFKIAMMCVEDESAARPTMREVVHMLTNPPQSHSAPHNLPLLAL